MKKLIFLPLLGLLVVSSSGCATREYVSQQTEPLAERISKLEGKDIPMMEREAKEAAEKAAAAAKQSEDAARKAEDAAKRAEAAAKKAEEATKKAETAAEKAAKAFDLMQRK
jgi:membrane protein involved in colicin uptake